MIIQGKLPESSSLVNLTIEGPMVTRMEIASGQARPDFGGPDLFLSGGFFDPQVNGFGGVDFNGRGLTPEELHHAALALASSGVTCFLPTFTTSPRERTAAQLKIFAEAHRTDVLVRRMCPGVHLEGPYISPEEGFRGAHPREFVRPPSWEELKIFQKACGGLIRCITLAPEVDGAIGFIERASADGIIIGLGHTNASEEILEDAARSGAKISTHLGNGAHALLPRHRNPIQKQLSMDGLMASIIADGIHLPDYVVKNYIRAKGIERVLLTTDSMAGAGAPPGLYTIGDLEVEVGPDRTARLPGTPYLAGSTLAMDQAVGNVIRFAGLPLASALKMAGENGTKLFPEAGREFTPGSPADIVLLEYRDKLEIKSTWVHGEKVF
jgi:N-acetylglucosamine-6-phosphate deacetylase